MNISKDQDVFLSNRQQNPQLKDSKKDRQNINQNADNARILLNKVIEKYTRKQVKA